MPLILRGPPGPKQGISAEDDTRLSLATDKAKIGALGVQVASSICTLAYRSCFTLSPDQKVFNLVDKQYSTLINATRNSIGSDIENMQEKVAAYFQPRTQANEALYQAKLAQVKKLDWPPVRSVDLRFKWADEPVVGKGTGYYIGNSFIATASHCLDESRLDEDKGSDWAQDIYAIFGLFDAKTPIPSAQVFKLKRVILKTTRPRIEYETANLVLDTAKLAEAQRHYDMAIVEITPVVLANAQLPAPLVFNAMPAQIDDRVHTIGSPRGLALKYSSGGVVQRKANNPAPNGCFNVDLDAFHGCSGSPILTGNRILGTMASIYPRSFPLSYSSDRHSDIFYNLDNWSKKVDGPNDPGSVPLQDDFLTSYARSDCCDFYDGNGFISWQRATPEANKTARGGCTTRFDPYAHLLQSLTTFDTNNTLQPFGNSVLEISVPLSGQQDEAKPISQIHLEIRDNGQAPQVHRSQIIGRNPQFNPTDVLVFRRTTADNANPADGQVMAAPYNLAAPPSTPGYALAPRTLWDSATPLLWRTVTIVSNNGWEGSMMPDFSGSKISLTYNRQAAEERWDAEKFTFSAPIRWNPHGPQGNSWEGFIGDVNKREDQQNASWWDGPLS